MRIAIFTETYYPYISGVITHVQALYTGLKQAGHDVLIVTLSPTAKRHYIEDDVLYCPARPMEKMYGYGIANPMNRERLDIIRKFNPDVLHTHTEFSIGIFALYCARMMKLPIVYTLHTMYDDYLFYLFPKKTLRFTRPMAHAYFRGIARSTTEIIGPSEKVAHFLNHILKVRRKVHVIPNTVDLSIFNERNIPTDDVKSVKDRLGIKTRDIPLVFVGRLGEEKSIDVLVDYFHKAFKDEPKYKLLIIGDGPEKEKIAAQIARLNAEKQILLLGRVEHDEIPPYYQACKLFTTASTSEMNSISLLEANASGLYAVQRYDPNNRQQIKQGINGEEFHTVEQFKEIVQGHASLSAADKKKRRSGVVKYAHRYGIPEFTTAVLKIYTKAIKRNAKEKIKKGRRSFLKK